LVTVTAIVLVIGELAVGHLDDDVIDIVGARIGRGFEIRRRDETQLARQRSSMLNLSWSAPPLIE
jgi:hypothetical protein